MQDFKKVIEERMKQAIRAADEDCLKTLIEGWKTRKPVAIPRWLLDESGSYGRQDYRQAL